MDWLRRCLEKPAISFRLAATVKPGKLQDLKDVATEMGDLVQRREPGTLVYEWYLVGDDLYIIEVYKDAQSVSAHMETFAAYSERFLACVDVASPLRLLGQPSASNVAAAQPFGPVKCPKIAGFKNLAPGSASSAGKALTLMFAHKVKPGKLQDVKKALNALVRKTKALEPDCQVYEYFFDGVDRLLTFERWATSEAFLQHMSNVEKELPGLLELIDMDPKLVVLGSPSDAAAEVVKQFGAVAADKIAGFCR